MTQLTPRRFSTARDLMDYDRKKGHYQTDSVARQYDATRWTKPGRRWSNHRKLSAIRKAIDAAIAFNNQPIKNALDLPCGTGRIFSVLFSKNIRVTGADISSEMMKVARGKSANTPLQNGFIRCDAEQLPFGSNRFDSVFSIRFLFHLPGEARQNALREMARVSRHWVIVDYRHKYTLKYLLKRLKQKFGLFSKPYHRLSRQEISEDFQRAGLDMVQIFPTFPFFSDKWVVLARKIG